MNLTIEERIYNLENSIESSKQTDMKIAVFNIEIQELVNDGHLKTSDIANLQNMRNAQTKKRATVKNQRENKKREKLEEEELVELKMLKKRLKIEQIKLRLEIDEFKLKILNN